MTESCLSALFYIQTVSIFSNTLSEARPVRLFKIKRTNGSDAFLISDTKWRHWVCFASAAGRFKDADWNEPNFKTLKWLEFICRRLWIDLKFHYLWCEPGKVLNCGWGGVKRPEQHVEPGHSEASCEGRTGSVKWIWFCSQVEVLQQQQDVMAHITINQYLQQVTLTHCSMLVLFHLVTCRGLHRAALTLLRWCFTPAGLRGHW